MTTRTLFRSIYRKVRRKTVDRFFESQRQRHFDISATFRLRSWRFAFGAATAKQVSEDIAKAAAAAALSCSSTKIKAGKIKRGAASVGRARACLSRIRK